MKPRFRLPIALVALLALSVYFAEGVLAAVCAPESPVAEAQHEGKGHGGHCPTDEAGGGGTELPRSEKPPCPLGPLGGGGSCVAASLPSSTVHVSPGFPQDLRVRPSTHAARDLLLAAALFHPPRS
jgi:hypothetical protein